MVDTQVSRNGSVGTERRRVFSGIQPSGELHLGNYLGAMKGWAERQHEKENFFCIVDLHAITVPQEPELLRRRTRSVAAMLLATGLSPDRCTLFHPEPTSRPTSRGGWLLNCITPVGWLERMTQFKDKSTGDERVSTGLLDYPVLMTADIICTTPTRCRWGTTRGSTSSWRGTSPSASTGSSARRSSCPRR